MNDDLKNQLMILRRNGQVVEFQPDKIRLAIAKAFVYDEHGKPYRAGQSSPSASEMEQINVITQAVIGGLQRRYPTGGTVHIEDVQDQVELALMRAGHQQVARGYVLNRELKARARQEKQEDQAAVKPAGQQLHVTDDGRREPLDVEGLRRSIEEACQGLAHADADLVFAGTLKNLYDGVSREELERATVMVARSLIERHPDYAYAAARLLLDAVRREVLGEAASQADMAARYAEYFPAFIRRGIDAELLDTRLKEFDLARLGEALDASRDLQFKYLGLQTLYDRYFLHAGGRHIELPQAFFMRVAMGLALNEIDRETRAIEFYNVLSRFDFMSSTPTLFNAGTRHSQLSSCYLTTVSDDLEGIYEAIKDNALLSKFAGGLGNDWSNVRALGSHIKGTNGQSQGVVPFLKVVNDTAVAVNQGGKRKGAVCAYLETWHLDIEEFLDAKKNTGDERRRLHDMNTANWIPDLFMKRVTENGQWTLFSPADVPDLHDKVGKAFEAAYVAYEAMADRGEIKLHRRMPAVQLWRKMLSMLFETGHPWVTFKDPCNIRSPQDHVGVVHSSNLCTEITLNTSGSEIAVCNLGSVNLPAHMKDGRLDLDKLRRTVRTAMRMLDNVIDINYYAVSKARNANLKHRPVGMGVMGFQDCLYLLQVPYASDAAVTFADQSMEAVCFFAYEASSDLAVERGSYSTFKGSKWARGLMPLDTLSLLRDERGGYVETDESMTMDWDALRAKIQSQGMRNSNCVAIAPTATIANIVGVSASIEPTYQNLFVKSNLSGEFTVVNEYLVEELMRRNLWDEVMVADLKYFDGALSRIDRVPDEVKALFQTAFEVGPQWLVEAGARRQKWIDQAQSLNLYVSQPSGKLLDDTYKLAWKRGLKTTYYLRTLGATHAEKSTVEAGALNAVPVDGGLGGAGEELPKACSIDNPDCEACQ